MKDHKILGILVSGGGLGTARATVVAPRDAIDGDLTSISDLDGFNSVVTSNSTHSVVELRYADRESPSVIQVIGTTVIPEFGSLASIALTASIIGAMATFRIHPYRKKD